MTNHINPYRCLFRQRIYVYICHDLHYIYVSFTSLAPATPSIIHEKCSAVNNSVTVSWRAPNHSFIDGFVLELDDGSGGEFRVSDMYRHT